jgi:hypothetical protein
MKIPKEEPKYTTSNLDNEKYKDYSVSKEEPKQIKCYCGHTTYCDCGPLDELKQTLEEANWKVLGTKDDTFYNGANWQAKRMYSEEDMINFAKYILSKKVTIARSPLDVSIYLPKEFQLLSGELEHNGKKLLKEWFEQFKKNKND